jgi:hypothetical protein
MVLFRGERAETHGNLSLFREAETCADVGAGCGSQLVSVYSGGDKGDALGPNAVERERVAYGPRDRDYAPRPDPE